MIFNHLNPLTPRGDSQFLTLDVLQETKTWPKVPTVTMSLVSCWYRPAFGIWVECHCRGETEGNKSTSSLCAHHVSGMILDKTCCTEGRTQSFCGWCSNGLNVSCWNCEELLICTLFCLSFLYNHELDVVRWWVAVSNVINRCHLTVGTVPLNKFL